MAEEKVGLQKYALQLVDLVKYQNLMNYEAQETKLSVFY